jgi:inner membrane protein
MDPLTHGLLGAVTAQGVFGRRLPRHAAAIGALSGMAPDLDVLIASASDPLLAWVYHRQFTHALAFIPLGAALAALPCLLLASMRRQWRLLYGTSLIAYATHAPLDALTSYGTQLFWPFSDYRVALDWMPIIDLVFTPILWIGLLLAVWRASPQPARAALALALAYIGFGAWQHGAALAAQQQLAQARGHTVERGRVLPLPGGLVVWRSLYLADGQLHADGVRVPWRGAVEVKPGSSRPLGMPPAGGGPLADRAREAWAVFAWFAQGEVIEVAPGIYGDARYSLDPAGFVPLWGLRIDPDRGMAYAWNAPTARDLGSVRELWRLTIQGDPRYQLLDAALAR